MSIASEISRLSSNISDSLDAVAAKGVTVPSDSNSDDLPGLIALIEQSSGGDSGGTIYQDTDGYLHLSEDDKNVISIVDTLDTAGGTVRTITSKVENPVTYSDMVNTFINKEISGDIVLNSSTIAMGPSYLMSGQPITSFRADGWTSIQTAYYFQNCSSLTTIHFPNAKNLYAANCFDGCSSLTMACFPKLGTGNIGYMYDNTFRNCSSLEIVDLNVLGNATRGFGGGDFYGCSKLKTLILRKSDAPVVLGNTTWTNSSIASGGSGCTIYIPKALYDHLGDDSSLDYKAATNWSTTDAYGTITWAQIEGSIYETQYADGTPIT